MTIGRSSLRHAIAATVFVTLATSLGGGVARAQEPAAPVRAAGRGVLVVALGGTTADAAKALAREVYADDAMRPTIDEATARALAGAPLDDGAPQAVAELAALRASLDPDPTNPATRRAVESVAAQLGAAGVLLVHGGAETGPRALLVRVGAAGAPAVELVGASAGADASWPGALASLRALLGGSAAPPPPARTTRPPPGTTQPSAASAPAPAPGLASSRPGPPGPPASPGPPAPAEEPPEFWERPWFWVALGAFAAAGVTALVVTQTAGDDEESSDTVRFRATIPRATVQFSLPP